VPTVTKSFAPIRGKAFRLTRLDECGVPVIGPSTTRVSKGFVSINTKFSFSKPNDVSVTTADNMLAFNEPGNPQLQNIAVDISFTQVDPDVLGVITGWQTVVDGLANGVGYRANSGIQLTAPWALEVWTDVAGVFCGTGDKPYGYTLFPFLRGGTLTDFNIDSGAATIGISSNTREGAGWGTGPYNVVDVSSTPGTVTPGKLLSPIGVRDHMHMQVTTIAPPAETGGLVALAAG
jgi:hypothetical protein